MNNIKKIKVRKKYLDIINYSNNHKIKYINRQFPDNISYLIWSRQLNNINYFKKIVLKMTKEDTYINNYVSPLIVKFIDKDIYIKPFWNNKIQELSDQLFIPSRNNIQLLDKHNIQTFNYPNWFDITKYVPVNNIINNNKFTHTNNIQQIEEYTKTKKIRVYLNKLQRQYMTQIIGTYRYYYNRCVDYFNNYNAKTNSTYFYIYPTDKKEQITIKFNKEDKRYQYMTARKYLNKNRPKWLLPNFPTHLIDQAIIECCNRMKTCLTNYIKYNRIFNLKYKKKKELVQTINLEKQMIRNIKSKLLMNLFVNWKINGQYIFRNIKLSQRLPVNYGGGNISYHRILKCYYINISYTAKETINTIQLSNKLCAIDQGIRTPFVIFNKDEVVTIGDNCTKKLYAKCKEIDIIKSRIDRPEYYIYKNNEKHTYKVNSSRKRNLKGALHRKIREIKNLKDELHNKTVKYLTDTYKGIILPPFNIQNMAGKLASKTARNMYTLSFYMFKMKLKQKAQIKNVDVFEYSEPYTSKTCGQCGKINLLLGNSKDFKCLGCNLEIDRDINGARNILLRNYEFINK